MILADGQSLEAELLKLLDQVLDMLEVVCRTEEPVNHILEDYRDNKHLTHIIQRLMDVASNEFKEQASNRRRLRQQNDRLKERFDQQLRNFKLERAQHIKLEMELKNYIESLQRQPTVTKQQGGSHATSKESRSNHKPAKSLYPPIPTTTSTVPSAMLSRHS